MSNPTLKDLRAGSILSGRLSEPQVKMLTHMPFVVFDGVKQVEVDYNIQLTPAGAEEHPGSQVTLTIDFDPEKAQHSEKHVKMLAQAIKAATFDNVKVTVFRKGAEKPLEGSDV